MMKSFSFKKVALSALMVGAMGVQAHAPEGLYGGVQVGVQSTDHQFRNNQGPGFYQNYALGSAGAVGGLTLGYQDHFHESNWVWGLDVSALYTREHADYNWSGAIAVRDAVQKTWDFSSTLKVGYDAGSVTPYVFGGVSLGHFKTLVRVNAADPAETKKDYKTGFIAGLGVSTVLCAGQELDFRYAYKRYGKMRGKPVALLPDTYSARFRSHEFLLTYKVFLDKDANGMKHEMPAFDPNGFVWGVGAGYQSLNTKMNHVYERFPDSPVQIKAQGSSPFLDVLLGYQMKLGQFVLGADVSTSYAFMGIKMKNIDPAGDSFRTIRQTWDTRAVARLGYQFGDGMIPYLTVGLSYARFKASLNNLPAGETLYGSTHKWRTGLVLGAGVQLPVSEKDSLDLSYSYARYKKLSFSAPAAIPGGGATSDYKPRTHKFMVSYRMKL